MKVKLLLPVISRYLPILNSRREGKADKGRRDLNYAEISPSLECLLPIWAPFLKFDSVPQEGFNPEEISHVVKIGVPRCFRARIWTLLYQHHRARGLEVTFSKRVLHQSYDRLLQQLTTHQQAILIDLGRTFPHHPYFSEHLGEGQLALFNVLKAYSLADPEVGYCQGVSFIAGILLMHMDEEDAFETLRYLMFGMNLRQRFRPDMLALQRMLYQLSRFLHDTDRELYRHLEKFDVSPMLYAASWFLTLFSSQFPIGFVSRVFDLVFLFGPDVIFSVILALLKEHRELLLQCDSFDVIIDFLKTTLPDLAIIQQERVMNHVFKMNLTEQLRRYDIEYQVLQEEFLSDGEAEVDGAYSDSDDDSSIKLEQENHHLKQLLHQSQARQYALEKELQHLRSSNHNMEIQMRSLQIVEENHIDEFTAA